MYKNLKVFRESLGMTQKEFAASLGIGQTTYNGYETGARDPKSDFWVSVAKKYNVTIDYLMGYSNDPHKTSDDIKKAPSLSDEAQRLARDYDTLDKWGQQAVRDLVDNELARIGWQEEPETKVIPLFGNSFAAGVAEPDMGNAWEPYNVEASSRADFAIKINGDSMEPYLHDGSIALGKRGNPENGEVGAFLLDGEFLCKQYCQDHLGNVHLLSLNRARADADLTIWHDSGRALLCFGKILMDKVPLPGV